jgi:tetratricopeptide (TPR) repeat protein|tara:strand:- start:57094 stop:57723 length:630 start_codon:yes stop_codon:yes gene_type:complete
MNRLFGIAAKFCPVLLGLLFAVVHIQVQAQSITVMGGSIAHNCFKSAEYAVSTGAGSRRDVDECTQAIRSRSLGRRDLVATHINRGIISAKLGQISDAQEDYLTALEISDQSPEIYLNLGNLQFLMQDFNNAIADYNQAESLGGLEQNPQILYLNRGMALVRLGRLDDAEAEYQMALEQRPGWANALDQLDLLKRIRQELAEESQADSQ